MHDAEEMLTITAEDCTIEIEVIESEDDSACVIDEVEIRGFVFPRRTGRVFSRYR